MKPALLYPVFSDRPTEQEIFRARVFSEPLVPVGPTTAEENRGLADAITSYLQNRKSEDLGAIEAFLKDHPGSGWRASLLTNAGLLWRRLAYFTRAERALHEAWDLAKGAEDAHGKATADRALGELLDIHMAFGRVAPLEDLLKEVEGRDMRGAAAERVQDAKGTVWVLREKHEMALPSGPIALQQILHQLRPGQPPNKVLAGFHADANGATLPEMQSLARKAGMNLQMAFRPSGLDVTPEGKPLSLNIPTPSMVHLKAGHFGALVEVRNDRVRLDDPLLGGEIWMTRRALEEEASGYFLIPDGLLPRGWRVAEARETEQIRGKCLALLVDLLLGPLCGKRQGGNGGCSGGDCPPMVTYSFHTALASLILTDTPVGYTPPRGPEVAFQVVYN
ncbi:MAG: cysteine peptidase family C39 domain-containing protein, partial [Anaerolineales bacterium]